ncbi:hypothetical protein ACFQX6_23720 [Streptosporangium lutulentum]
MAYGFAGAIVLGALLLAIFLPRPFTVADKFAMLVLGLLVAGILHLLGRCRVEADERGSPSSTRFGCTATSGPRCSRSP